jgi:hypothetical protein
MEASIGKQSAILRDITANIDSGGALDSALVEELSLVIHSFSKQAKEQKKDLEWKEVVKLLNALDNTLMAAKTSFSVQQEAWGKQQKVWNQQSQQHLQRTVANLRMQAGEAVRAARTEMSDMVAGLQKEKEQLLKRLGFGLSGTGGVGSSGSGSGSGLGEGTENAGTVLSSSGNSEEKENKATSPSVMAGGDLEVQSEQTIFECLRLHEEVVTCKQKLASQELVEQALREELRQVRAEVGARDEDILVLKESVSGAGRRFDQAKDKHNADLRRLSNEYIAQKAHFREIMNKFRSQVESEMGRQRDEAVSRIKREREAIATSSAMANERNTENLQAALATRVAALQERQKDELASARHMHKQELQRVLAENDRLKRVMYSKGAGARASLSQGSGAGAGLGGSRERGGGTGTGSSSSPSSPPLAEPWYTPVVHRNELPWGSGGSGGTSHADLTLGLSEGARHFSSELDKLLRSLGPDGEVELSSRNSPTRSSLGGSRTSRSDASIPAVAPPRSRRSPTPPLPQEGGFGAGAGAGAGPSNGFILSARHAQSAPPVGNLAPQGGGGSSISPSYKDRFDARASPEGLIAAALGPDALPSGRPLETVEMVAQRAEDRALAAADDAACRYRIAQKTEEELVLEAELAGISRGSPAAVNKARAQAKALAQARLLSSAARGAEARMDEKKNEDENDDDDDDDGDDDGDGDGDGDDDDDDDDDDDEDGDGDGDGEGHRREKHATPAPPSPAPVQTLTLEDLANKSLLSPQDETQSAKRHDGYGYGHEQRHGHHHHGRHHLKEGEASAPVGPTPAPARATLPPTSTSPLAEPCTASVAMGGMAAQRDAEAGRQLLGGAILDDTTFMEEWNDSFSDAMRLGNKEP